MENIVDAENLFTKKIRTEEANIKEVTDKEIMDAIFLILVIIRQLIQMFTRQCSSTRKLGILWVKMFAKL